MKFTRNQSLPHKVDYWIIDQKGLTQGMIMNNDPKFDRSNFFAIQNLLQVTNFMKIEAELPENVTVLKMFELILADMPTAKNFTQLRQEITAKINNLKPEYDNYANYLLDDSIVKSKEKIHEVFNENEFWKIVEKAKNNASNRIEQQQYLIQELIKLTPEQIIGFRLQTDKLLYESYTSELFSACYIMHEVTTDNSFEHFRNWLISMGKETYDKIIDKVDNLVEHVTDTTVVFEFENFWSIAIVAFKFKTQKHLFHYVDYANFEYKSRMHSAYPKFGSTKRYSEICPELCKVYGRDYLPNHSAGK
ncbi:MAG: DUF4240 domain-containing protein [Crocinitomix sp.]|nr:DUF4240 domain-containing protein [Crocinitomix sp.]